MRIFRLVILLLTLMTPWPCAAMDVELFDDLAVEDQRDYVAFMSRRAKEILNQEGRGDVAERIDELFQTRRGQKQSLGERQFYENLARIRSFIAEQATSHVHVQFLGGHVVNAFVTTLARNQVQIPSRFPVNFSRSLREKPYWAKRPLRASP